MLETSDSILLPLPSDAKIQDGQSVVLGVRPEHLTLTNGTLPFHVDLLEPLGREILMYGTIGLSKICMTPGYRPSIAEGETIKVSYDPEKASVFDASSGRSLQHGY